MKTLPSPAKAFIFDMDGTLLDTLADLALACNTLLANHALPTHPLASYKIFVGNGFRKLVQRSLPSAYLEKLPEEEFVRFMAEAKEIYSRNLWTNTRPYGGMEKTLAQLSAHGCRLAVLSNKPDRETRLLADHFFQDVFAVVCGQRPEVPLKPDPSALNAILDQMGVAKQDAVYVGDTATDMETANNAGLFAAGVTWGFRSEEELRTSGADIVVHSPEELVHLAQK